MTTAALKTPARETLNRPRVYDRLSVAAVRDALRKMHLIRRFEESAEDAYVRGQSYGTMHLSIGQEATAVGICAHQSALRNGERVAIPDFTGSAVHAAAQA